jgi:PmbA protein
VERLMEMAAKVSDQAEIYSLEEVSDGISFENATLKDIESKSQSGLSLRLIRQGRLGFAYTRNLLHRQEVLRNGLDSLKGEVEAAFDFPLTKDLPPLDTVDPSLEETSNAAMVEECNRVCGFLSEKRAGSGC